MKPWIAFLGGAVVAAGVALVGLRPQPAPVPEPAPIVAQQVSPVEPIGAEPEKPVEAAPSTPPPAPAPAPSHPKSSPKSPRVSTGNRTPSPPPAPTHTTTPPSITPPAETPTAPATPPAAAPETPASSSSSSSPQPEQTAQNTVREPEAPIPPPPPNQVTIGAGTKVSVRLAQNVSTEQSHVGDSFTATLDQPLVVEGFVLAERGARVTGKITASDPGGRVKGVSLLGLELTSFRTSDGQTIDIKTVEFRKEGENSTRDDAAKVAIGAGVGAALGAIFGGGKGAAIGAGSGAAAGTGVVLATRGKAANLPAETRLTFQLQAPVTITEKR